MNPIIYDFKRSFLRLSVLIFLVVFAAVGVGIGYLVYHSSVENLPASSYYNMNFVGVSFGFPNGTVKVHGYVFDNRGSPLVATIEMVSNSGKVVSMTQSNSSGFFTIQGNNASYIIVKYSTYEEKATITTIAAAGKSLLLQHTVMYTYIIYNVSDFYNYYEYNGEGLAIITGVKNCVGKLILASTFNQGELNLTFYNQGLKAIGSCIINYSGYVTINSIKIKLGTQFISLGSKSSIGFMTEYSPIPHIEYAINQGVISSSSLFQSFFPIIMIYLAYALYSKLIDSGAIEFIISRPLTRASFYLTRLTSGLLTGVTTSIIFGLLVGGTFSILIHYFPSFVVTMLIIELISILSFYYILSFMLSNFIKSATATLGISIALFFIIRIVEGILPIFLPTNASNVIGYYVNPTSLCSVATYLSTHLTLAGAPFNLGISIVAQLAWLIGLSLLGYLKFRRMDL
ncbi:MAG: ABC transporter permease subunit [Acidianus sp.]|uniref:ABC transporter permease subunit n=1 Tax=Acidianus sp. TaxID=1872104 RepID=UPI003979D076